MTQTLVLKKLAKFLLLYKDQHLATLKEKKEKFPELEKKISEEEEEFKKTIEHLHKTLGAGHCFGFSAIHALKGPPGSKMLNWWEQVLIDIVWWDEDPKSLNDIESLKILPKEFGQMDGWSTFYYALHHIVTSQINKRLFDKLLEADQTTVFEPERHMIKIPASQTDPINQPAYELKRSIFEVVTRQDNGKTVIKTIKKRKIMAGNLTEDQLNADLKGVGHLVLAHSLDHTIRMSCQESEAMVYDPNYPHEKNPIHKTGAISECTKELLTITGPAIGIEVMSYDENANFEFKEYDKRVKNFPLSLIRDNGLWIMAKFSPQTLESILLSIQDRFSKDIFSKVIQEAISKPNFDWTTMHILARYAGDALLQMLNLIDDGVLRADILLPAIIESLVKKTNNKCTVLHMMVRYAPKAFSKLCRFIHHSDAEDILLPAMIQAFPMQNCEGWTLAHAILSYCPQSFFDLLNCIDHTPRGVLFHKAVLDALSKQNVKGDTGLAFLDEESSSRKFSTVDLVLGDTGLHLTLQGLLTKNNKNKSAWTDIVDQDLKNNLIKRFTKEFFKPQQDQEASWQLICKQAPDMKKKLLTCIKKHINKMSKSELALYVNKVRHHRFSKGRENSNNGLFSDKNVHFNFWRMILMLTERVLHKKNEKKFGKYHAVSRRF